MTVSLGELENWHRHRAVAARRASHGLSATFHARVAGMLSDLQHAYCARVDKIAEAEFGVTDGADLCYNLLQDGRASVSNSARETARLVAQLALQP